MTRSDRVACHRARSRILELLRHQGQRSGRFEELSKQTPSLITKLDNNEPLRLHINPLRVWTTLKSGESSKAREDTQPSSVLFYACRGGVAAATLQLEGQALLNELIDFAPCTWTEWRAHSRWAKGDQFHEFLRSSARLGLIALS